MGQRLTGKEVKNSNQGHYTEIWGRQLNILNYVPNKSRLRNESEMAEILYDRGCNFLKNSCQRWGFHHLWTRRRLWWWIPTCCDGVFKNTWPPIPFRYHLCLQGLEKRSIESNCSLTSLINFSAIPGNITNGGCAPSKLEVPDRTVMSLNARTGLIYEFHNMLSVVAGSSRANRVFHCLLDCCAIQYWLRAWMRICEGYSE